MSMNSGFMSRMMNEGDKAYRLRDLHRGVFKMFMGYLKPQIKTLMLALVFMTIVAAVNMFVPYLSKVAIDEMIIPGNVSGLHLILTGFAGAYAVFWVASYWGRYLSVKLGQRVVASIRKDLFQHVISLSMDFYTERKTGEIMSRLTNDINTLSDFISSGIVNLLSDIITLVGIIVVMFLLNVQLAWIVLITIPVIFVGTLLIGRQMRKAYKKVREKTGELNAGVEENISGIRVVQAMSQETDNMKSFEKLNKENLYAQIKAVVISALFFPFMSLTGTLGTALVILAGGIMVVNGESGATIGVLMAFIAYTNRFFLPLRDLSQIYNVYQQAAASADRIYEYFQIKPTITSPKKPVMLSRPVQGEIGFHQVHFQYEANQPVIKNMSVTIPSGETTAIVGPSGAGKSTMIKLMARLYDVDDGKVTIDGVDIRKINMQQLREIMMLVPQDVFLFTGTILENIRYSNPNATDDQVIQAAKTARADDFIRQLPKGYQTEVGEGGILLSGGQRQLIAFARATLTASPILILDEATSSVDAATEAQMQQALDQLVMGRTSVIIAHRFTTLRKAKRIIVVDQGQIVGYDTHERLLEHCEVYKQLYEKQYK